MTEGDSTAEPDPHAEQSSQLPELALRAFAIRDLLLEKGILVEDDIDRVVRLVDGQAPPIGAEIVARAWTDDDFKRRVLDDAGAAIAEEFGVDTWDGVEFKLVAVENTAAKRHLVVCTLCSCYPRNVLGRSPDWYKSAAYRARAVSQPREVLGEFGTDIDDKVEIAVHDSTADIRYIVIPQRPPGTSGMSEHDLAALVARDCLIGVADPDLPPAK